MDLSLGTTTYGGWEADGWEKDNWKSDSDGIDHWKATDRGQGQ